MLAIIGTLARVPEHPPPKRVFIGLVEVAGFYGRLAAGFAEIGVQATFVDLTSNPFGYSQPASSRLVQWTKITARRRERSGAGGSESAPAWRVVHRLMLILLFGWAVLRHDVFIFSYRSTFFWFLELPVLKALRKRVIYVFNGTDARPAYIDGADMSQQPPASVDELIELTRRKKRDIRRIERWADHIVAHPLYLHLFTRPALGIQVLGIPVPSSPDSVQGQPEPASLRVRILHAPSNEAVKGSELIRRAVRKLNDDGLALELIELHGVANDEVQRELRSCDFVIDQMYSDLPMSVFAAEAAVHGKPSVVGSYGWEHIDVSLPARYRGPVERCHPDRLTVAIHRLSVDVEHRQTLGRKAHQFVESWTPMEVARRYERLFVGDVPDEWLTSPLACRYLHGVGLSEERAQNSVRDVLRRGGVAGLILDDRPDLQARFAEFADAAE